LDKTTTTGITFIDNQHRKLFESFNNVFKALALAKETQELLEILELMDRCVKHHLSSEEDLMVKNSYPKYIQHKSAHERFIENISLIKEETSKKGVTSSLAQTIKETVGDWFLSHIKIMDMQYVPFLQNKVK